MTDDMLAPTLSQRRRVVVADPFPITRGAVAALLRRSGVVDAVHEAADASSAMRAVRQHDADLIVTDVDLTAPADGVRLCGSAKRLARPLSVLMFSASNDPAVLARCMTAGADGYVHRSAQPDRLVQALESLAVGRPVWYLGETPVERSSAQLHRYAHQHGMTAREHQILGLLLGRYSNAEIATELHLARQTVKNHVSNVLRKVGAANRRELLSGQPRVSKDTSPVILKRNSANAFPTLA